MTSDIQIARASRVTFIGNMLNFALLSVQLLVITPLLLRSVGPQVAGAWVASGDVLVWLQSFDFGLSSFAIQKMSAAYSRVDIPDLTHWFWSTLVLLLLLAVLIVVGGGLTAPLVFHSFGLPPEVQADLTSAFRLGLLATGVTVVSYALTGLARALHAPELPMLGILLGTVLGMAVTYWGITAGMGVRAVAYGLLIRAGCNLAGGVLGWWVFWRAGSVRLALPAPSQLRESVRVMPFSAVGSLGYAISNQSDNFLVASLFGPGLTMQFNTTRRLAELGRSVIETVGYANFAAFSHKYAADAHESQGLYRGLLRIQRDLSLVLGGGFILVNERFLHLWVGETYFLGTWISVLMAMQMFFTTRSYLLNNLNRAMGRPQPAYLVLAIEAAVKIALILLVARQLGVGSLLMIAVAVAGSSMTLLSHWNTRRFRTSLSNLSGTVQSATTEDLRRTDAAWVLVSLFFCVQGGLREIGEGPALVGFFCLVAGLLWNHMKHGHGEAR